MYGRYGFDRLTKYLLIFYFAAWVIGNIVIRIVPSYTVYLVFNAIMLATIIYALFRTLSKNIPARRRENERFERLLSRLGKGKHDKTGGYGNYGSYKVPPVYTARVKTKKPKSTREHKYAACRECGAVMRLKRRRGLHTAVCPKCGRDIRVFSFYGK